MSYTSAIDISRWQGNITFLAVPQPIVMMKISGGDQGLYYDDKAAVDWPAAVAAGKGVGGYHFAGGGDPVAEANYFVKGMEPFAEGDVYALDWEIEHADPVAWVNQFTVTVHGLTGAWPLVYMDVDRCNRFDWSSVFANCGLWIAAPSYGFNDTVPVKYPIVMQQGPTVQDPGIPNNVTDTDAFYGSVDQFRKYGYHATPAPAPAPVPPAPEPTPTPEPQPTPVPVPPAPVPTPPGKVIPPAPSPVKRNFFQWLLYLLSKLKIQL